MRSSVSDFSAVDADIDSPLEQLMSPASLGQMVGSFSRLTGVAVRLYSPSNALLSQAGSSEGLCSYLQQFPACHRACAQTRNHLHSASIVRHPTSPGDGSDDAASEDAWGALDFGELEDGDNPESLDNVGDVERLAKPHDAREADDVNDGYDVPCFTGARYRILRLRYNRRYIGRMVLGPYFPAETTRMPRSLAELGVQADPADVRRLVERMPRLTPSTVSAMIYHARAILDLIMRAGHKSLLAFEMHLTTQRQNYQELHDGNERLRAAYDKLKELDQLKSNFIATVSHELRTPLTSIIGYSEMLSEGLAGALNEQQHEFVTSIRENGDLLLSLIVTLLDLSKLEHATMSLERSEVSVSQILHEVQALLKPAALKAQVNVGIELQEPLPTVRADATRLRQAILNLADNAVKFTPAGGNVTLSAGVELGPTDATLPMRGYSVLAPAQSHVVISVADTGVGIAKDQRERIFTAFYQVDSSSNRQFSGSGLGLAIVKRLIQAHGGTVSVKSNTPCGSVFVISLPASDTDAGRLVERLPSEIP